MAVFKMELLLAYEVEVEAKDHTEAEEIANEDLDNFLGTGEAPQQFYGGMVHLACRVMSVDWKAKSDAGPDRL